MSQLPFPLPDFAGTARLFPLPNLVLFPHVAQPLHIFEPRYRQMMADALAGDRLLAMALLRPGWEDDYHGRPAIHPTVCLGRIRQEERLPDGRYNLLLQGATRARVVEEIPGPQPYRIARVELLPSVPVPCADVDRSLRATLAERAAPFFAAHPMAVEQLARLVGGPLPLGDLGDILAFALPLDLETKQRLLDEADVESRVRLLIDRLPPPAADACPRRGFPPHFSAN